MIKQLTLKNYILIDELSLNFQAGLNAITGETGAGKSIIINAVELIFAPRVSKEIIKTGETKAYLEVTFSADDKIKNCLEEFEIDDYGDELTITKEVTQNSVKTRVNGTIANQELIKALKENLIDIHSQHQTYAFMQPKYHINWLDNYAKDTYGKILSEYRESFKTYKNLCQELEEAITNSNDTENRIEFLKFQINEIENAAIEDVNEYDNLKDELKVLENAEKLKELTGSAYWALKGDENSIYEGLSKINANISKAESLDSKISEISENFINAVELLNETAANLRNYSQSLENNTQRLNEIQERLFLLDKLKRKYGSTLEEILQTYENLKNEHDKIENSAQNIDELKNQISELRKNLENTADILTKKRNEYATVLSSLIEDKLHNLELPKAKFKIDVKPCELNKDGKDKVEFLISTNVSEELKPLAKIASGGEISRVMLAIKSVFAQSDDIATVVFDEIDTGISGKASQSVAEELTELSKFHQIILITHQPIIASKANNYFYVRKKQNDNETIVDVQTLDETKKLEAIAELASGEVNEQSLEFARSLVFTE